MTQILISTSVVLLISALGSGCSTSRLRKFNEVDIGKELPAEVVKKFEVKESFTVPAPTPTPEPKSKKKKKTKISKEASMPAAATPVSAIPPKRRPSKMPFSVGEKLSYDIRYIGVTAGSFEIEIESMKVINNRSVYHLQGVAKTAKLFELIYRVNDVVESFFDEDGLYSHRFTMDLDESKQTRKVIELYDYDQKKSFYWNRIDHVDKGFSEQKEEHDIALWSQDPFSSLYYIRVAPLPSEPGEEYRFPVILDGKAWESRMTYIGVEQVYADGRYFEADAYSLQNYENGQLRNRENKVWMSKDEHRYILRVEAKIRVGSFAVALDKIL